MTDQDQENKVVLEKKEYDEIVSQLEELSEFQQQSGFHPIKNYQMMLFTRAFWDTLLTKLVASTVSVKMWILFTVLYYPYHLVREGKISGDNYANIVLVVAPLVLGLREFSKNSNKDDNSSDSAPTTTSSSSGSIPIVSQAAKAGQDALKSIRQRFNI